MASRTAAGEPLDVRRRKGATSDARRDVALLAVFICLADIVYGMVSPTFSLFVRGLGGSAFLIGVLTATVGAARLLCSLPVGTASDRIGRKNVLVGGGFLFAVSCALFTVSADPRMLVVPRVLFGLAILATFPIGAAYIADIVPRERQAIAISLYITAQGLGFAIGPFIGAVVARYTGYESAYRIAAGLAAATAIFGARYLRRAPRRHRQGAGVRSELRGSVLARGPILAASVSSLAMMMMFNGAILPFLSLFAADAGLGTVAIGYLYGARSIASMLTRIPRVTRRLTSANVMLTAMLADAVAAFTLAASHVPALLFVAAILDGIAFGGFLAASQATVAEHAAPHIRGAAMGAWATAGALGETAGALGFGLIGRFISVRLIFVVAGGCLLLDLIAARWLLTARPAARRPANSG